ncbi:hypothetical protein KP509_37G070100 [Ceratopteris richardii]|nr:hypothetical protein KP509_37G070100 [Ceratopteris richardii]
MKAIKSWARQILRGLLYLHSHDPPIIHRDLKCDNIFINGNQGEVKIGDLGLAVILRQAYAAHTVLGTPEFMAPELYDEEYTELVDIYAFGMCLLELVNLDYPYSECSNAAQIYKKVSSGIRPAALSRVRNPDLLKFIEECIAPASRRLTARELLMDPFLQFEKDSDYEYNLPFVWKGLPSSDSVDSFHYSSGKNMIKDSPSSSQTFQSLNSKLEAAGITDCVSSEDSRSVTPPSSAFTENEEGQRMDFQVKGKRRSEDIVHLRLRIEQQKGDVRCIGFLFKLGFDTPVSVATEMVSELDISDQNVTRIAEVIDAALQVIAPDWQLGKVTEGEARTHRTSDLAVFSEALHVDWTTDGSSAVSPDQ